MNGERVTYTVEKFFTRTGSQSPDWAPPAGRFTAQIEAAPNLLRGAADIDGHDGRYAFAATDPSAFEALAKAAGLASVVSEDGKWSAVEPLSEAWRDSVGAYRLWKGWRGGPDDPTDFGDTPIYWVGFSRVIKPRWITRVPDRDGKPRFENIHNEAIKTALDVVRHADDAGWLTLFRLIPHNEAGDADIEVVYLKPSAIDPNNPLAILLGE